MRRADRREKGLRRKRSDFGGRGRGVGESVAICVRRRNLGEKESRIHLRGRKGEGFCGLGGWEGGRGEDIWGEGEDKRRL